IYLSQSVFHIVYICFSFVPSCRDGVGVPKDDAQSMSWLQRAAYSGHPLAQYLLAARYLRDPGRNVDLAYHWAQQATEGTYSVAGSKLLLAKVTNEMKFLQVGIVN